jgi:pimeloyl-ACP methyl ester carboxylesterase
MQKYLLTLICLTFFAASLETHAYCPPPDDVNRYVVAKLRSESNDFSAGLINVYYALRAPFDPSKPTLLVLNGGPGGDHNIIHIFDNTEISKEMNIVSLDHRGLGCTKVLSADSSNYEPLIFSMKRAAEDIEEVRKDLLGKDGKWFVMGLSYGTMLGQQYAILYPNHIQGLILDSALHESKSLDYGRKQYVSLYIRSNEVVSDLFNQIVLRYPELEIEILRKIRTMTYGYFGRTQQIHRFLRKVYEAQSKSEVEKVLETVGDLEPPLVGMMRQIVCEEIWDYPNLTEAEQYFFWQFAVECRGFGKHRHPMSFSEGLARLSVRTFIWGGQFDPVTPIQAMREMQQLIPHSILWENAHVGHCLIGEKGVCAFQLARMFFKGASDSELKEVIQSTECQSAPKRHDASMKVRLRILEDSLRPLGIRFPLFEPVI